MSLADIVGLSFATAEDERQRDLFDLALGRIAHDACEARRMKLCADSAQAPSQGTLAPRILRAQQEQRIRDAVLAGLDARHEADLRKVVGEVFTFSVGGERPTKLEDLNAGLVFR